MIKYEVTMHYQTPGVSSVTVVSKQPHGRKKSARGEVKSLINSKLESLIAHNYFGAVDIQATIDPAEVTLFDENGAIIMHSCYEVREIETTS